MRNLIYQNSYLSIFLFKQREAKDLNKKLMDTESIEIEAKKRQKRAAEEEATTTAMLKDQSEAAKRKSSMFSDIKEMLKAVEFTKRQLEADERGKRAGERDPRTFYALSGTLEGDSERMRMKKLVDGCVNAISNDVKVKYWLLFYF